MRIQRRIVGFRRVLLPLFLLGGLTACQPSERHVTPAFYHWQTQLELSETEKHALKELAVERIYAKFFDVVWQPPTAVPTAEIRINSSSLPATVQIIPTIYVTNETLVNSTEDGLTELSINIIKKINTLAAQIPNFQLDELQIDCDWTLTTRTKYFQLLTTLKQRLPHTALSVTIRLHQIKYKNKTGIPPVARGVLMFYNTGDLQDWTSENTILELAEAKRYVRELADYNLPLDIALPIFQWGVVYREERMFKLINGLTATELHDRTRFTQLTDHRYTVAKSTYLRGHYLYQHDKIRLENVSATTLRESAKLLAPLINNNDFQLLFYHLDSLVLVQHPSATLQAIQREFE